MAAAECESSGEYQAEYGSQPSVERIETGRACGKLAQGKRSERKCTEGKRSERERAEGSESPGSVSRQCTEVETGSGTEESGRGSEGREREEVS